MIHLIIDYLIDSDGSGLIHRLKYVKISQSINQPIYRHSLIWSSGASNLLRLEPTEFNNSEIGSSDEPRNYLEICDIGLVMQSRAKAGYSGIIKQTFHSSEFIFDTLNASKLRNECRLSSYFYSRNVAKDFGFASFAPDYKLQNPKRYVVVKRIKQTVFRFAL